MSPRGNKRVFEFKMVFGDCELCAMVMNLLNASYAFLDYYIVPFKHFHCFALRLTAGTYFFYPNICLNVLIYIS